MLYTSIHLTFTRSPIQYRATAVSDTPVTIIFRIVGQSSASSDGGEGRVCDPLVFAVGLRMTTGGTQLYGSGDVQARFMCVR